MVLGLCGKTRRTVPSGVKATPILSGANALHTECLEPDIEDLVSSQTLELTALDEDGIASMVLTTTWRTETPERRFTTAHTPFLVVIQVEQRIMREPFELTVVSTGRKSIEENAASGNDISIRAGSLHSTTTKIVGDRGKWVALNR